MNLHPKSTFDLLTEYGYISQVGAEQLGSRRGMLSSSNGVTVPLECILSQNVIDVVEQDGKFLLYAGRNPREAMYREEPHGLVQAM